MVVVVVEVIDQEPERNLSCYTDTGLTQGYSTLYLP